MRGMNDTQERIRNFLLRKKYAGLCIHVDNESQRKIIQDIFIRYFFTENSSQFINEIFNESKYLSLRCISANDTYIIMAAKYSDNYWPMDFNSFIKLVPYFINGQT